MCANCGNNNQNGVGLFIENGNMPVLGAFNNNERRRTHRKTHASAQRSSKDLSCQGRGLFIGGRAQQIADGRRDRAESYGKSQIA